MENERREPSSRSNTRRYTLSLPFTDDTCMFGKRAEEGTLAISIVSTVSSRLRVKDSRTNSLHSCFTTISILPFGELNTSTSSAPTDCLWVLIQTLSVKQIFADELGTYQSCCSPKSKKSSVSDTPFRTGATTSRPGIQTRLRMSAVTCFVSTSCVFNVANASSITKL